MNNLQKDSMLANIIQQVQSQIIILVEQNLIQESMSLYREWEEHLNDDVRQVHIVTVNDLTLRK
jgi:hypothetical protein